MLSHSLEAVLLLVIAVLREAAFAQGTCPLFTLTSPPLGTYSCPGSNITYTCCVLSSNAFGVNTAWSGSAFQCPPTNQIGLLQRLSGVVQPFTPVSCGNLSAVTINVTSTCYTSVLTIPAVQALNGTTVVCQDGISGAVVGNNTVNLRMAASPGPVGNMIVTSTSVDQLKVTWIPPTTGGVPTSYNVTINDSSNSVVIADNGSPVYMHTHTHTHTFTGLVSDTLYTVSVVAINCAGASNAVLRNRRTLAGPPKIIQTISMFKPQNILSYFKVSWIPVGNSVTGYNVKVVGDDDAFIGQGSTTCTTSPCVHVQSISAPASRYNISVASINGDRSIGPANSTIINGPIENYMYIDARVSHLGPPNAVINCTFLKNQTLYCLVCCSTDPSVSPDSSVYNISAIRGTEVTVFIQGLTSGQMYYCTAAGSDVNSSSCGDPVYKHVETYFNISAAGLDKHPDDVLFSGSGHTIIILSVLFPAIIIIISTILVICMCYSYRKRTVKKLDPIEHTGCGQQAGGQVKDGIIPEEPSMAASCTIEMIACTHTRDVEHHCTCDPGGYDKCTRNMEQHRTCTCDDGVYDTCYPERGYEYIHVHLSRRTMGSSVDPEKKSQTQEISHGSQLEEPSTCAVKTGETAKAPPYLYSIPEVTKKNREEKLKFAAHYGNLENITTLLNQGTRIDATDGIMHKNTPLEGKSPIHILLGPEGTPCKKPCTITSIGDTECACRPEETDVSTPPPVLPDRDDQYTASRKWTNEHLKFEHSSEPKEAQQMCVQSLQL